MLCSTLICIYNSVLNLAGFSFSVLVPVLMKFQKELDATGRS